MKITTGLAAISLVSLSACQAAKSLANTVQDAASSAGEALSDAFSSSQTEEGLEDGPSVAETAYNVDQKGEARELPASMKGRANRAVHPTLIKLESWDERYIAMDLDEKTKLPRPTAKRIKMPKAYATLEDVVNQQIGWFPVNHKEPDRAGLGLVLAVHGYQMRLKHVMAELDGTTIYGRVENQVNAEIGDQEKTSREREAIRERIVRGLEPEDQKAFRDLVVANRQELAEHIAMIGGDVVFWTQGVEGTEGFLNDIKDGLNLKDFRKLQKVTAQITLATTQVRELRTVRSRCQEEASKLDDRLAAWDKVVEEL